MLIGALQKGSIFNTLTWLPQKSRRPVKSTAAAEILAVGEAIDKEKNLRDSMCMLIRKTFELTIVTDSKDLYNSLSTQRNSVDRSIRADVNIIRYEYEIGAVGNIVWNPGSTNPPDPATRKDSALADALQLMLQSGLIPFDFSKAESRSAHRSFG